jgi:PAS domain S-box-containing protein
MSTSTLSSRLKWPRVVDYGIACVTPTLAIVLDVSLSRLWGIDPPASVLLCGIMIVAWVSGPGPALLATALTVLAFDYLLMQPIYSLALEFKEFPRLALLTIAALLVVSLNTAQGRETTSLRRVRDEHQKTIHELGKLNEALRMEKEARRRSEAALSEARRELQLTIDSIPVMVSTFDPDGSRSFVNQQWQNYTGHTQREATGKGLNTYAYYHPDDIQRFDNAWRAAQAKGDMLSVDVRTRRADGTYRWYTMRRAPLRDEQGAVVKWYSVGIDVNDQKVAESSLQRSEAYLAEAQKLSLTGSIAWDITNDDHFWSDETYQIMGFDRSVKPSMDLIMQRVHPDDRAHLQHEVDRATKGAQHYDYESRLLMPDGQIKYLHVRAHRVTYASGKEEIVGALVDITESRTSQAALDAAQTALAHASRVATLGVICASIAHEVNQPLAAIVANGHAGLRFLCRETPDLNYVRGTIEWIIKDGNRAAEVIRRIRGLLKNEGTEKVPVDVNDLISETAALLQRELSAQHVTLGLDLASAMPPVVGDRVQLQQVIINLIVNGVDAMQAVADRPHILLIRSHENDANQIVIDVKDNGVGVPSETADRLFDAFFSTKPNGLGIGLSICRSIIRDHGGELWTTNNTEQPGATFQFALPSHRERMS